MHRKDILALFWAIQDDVKMPIFILNSPAELDILDG
jgi:hypothetical protein